MESKEKLLELLSKFGMDLSYHDPFLYERDNKYGLVYTFSHAFYGILTRVFFSDDEAEVEEFLYQYWWYKKYGETYHVTMELKSYDTFEMKPFFLLHERELSSQDMKELLVVPFQSTYTSKQLRLYQRYLRTARMLVSILELKIKFQEDTFHSVLDLNTELVKQKNEYIQLLNRYEKTNRPLEELDHNKELQVDYHIETFQKQLLDFETQEDIEELKAFIDTLWQKLFSVEGNIEHLQNKYSLILYPLKLEDLRAKKNYLETLFNKKKSLFSKKENAMLELQKIDERSEVKKIVKMDDYIQNEMKRLDEKYSIIDEIDYTTLGDYLNEFDNMGVDITFDVEGAVFKPAFSHHELLESLSSRNMSKTIVERQCMSIYHSFLEPICDDILELLLEEANEKLIVESIIKKHSKDLQRSLMVLSDPENVFVRMKKMKLLSLTNLKSFCISLVDVCKSILTMDQDLLERKCYVFGKSKKNDPLPFIYHASCKSSTSPAQKKGEYDIHDVLEIDPGVGFSIFTSYYTLKDPYFHDDTLVEEATREDVMIFLKKYQVKYLKSDILKVVRYKVDKNDKIVKNIQELRTDYYRHIIVTR